MLSNVVFLRLAFSCFPGGQVAKLFQDSSLGNAVNIVVTRLILLMEDQVKGTKLSLLLIQSAVTELQEPLYSTNPCGLLLWNQALAAERSTKARKKTGKRVMVEEKKGDCLAGNSLDLELSSTRGKSILCFGRLLLIVRRKGLF